MVACSSRCRSAGRGPTCSRCRQGLGPSIPGKGRLRDVLRLGLLAFSPITLVHLICCAGGRTCSWVRPQFAAWTARGCGPQDSQWRSVHSDSLSATVAFAVSESAFVHWKSAVPPGAVLGVLCPSIALTAIRSAALPPLAPLCCDHRRLPIQTTIQVCSTQSAQTCRCRNA